MCIGIDDRQGRIGIADAEQVVEQDEILLVGVHQPCPQPVPHGLVVKRRQADDRTQKLAERVERDVARM